MLRAFITGLEGAELTARERAFLRDVRPCGIILFARNCDTPEQLTRLIDDARGAVGDDRLLVLIDQEGGRVQRLRPPHWRALPPGRALGRLYERDPSKGLRAARAVARLMGRELRGQGITVDCAPVLDVPVPGAHGIIGDRAYGEDVETIIAIGREVAEGLIEGGVLPVIKHVPGHGRAGADSHHDLPVVEAPASLLRETDFRPFAALRDQPLAMTAHIVFTDYDRERPATLSPVIIGEVIRGLIGYEGLVMTDDLSMKALSGTLAERAAASFAAGVDVALHCNGEHDEMLEVAGASPDLSARALERFGAAVARLDEMRAFDAGEAEALLAEVLAAA